MNIYYVYALLDPRKKGNFQYDDLFFDDKPFYIGKGKNKRINDHFSESQLKRDTNKFKVNTILKIRECGLEPIKIKIYENLSEEKSLELENHIIN